MTAAFVLSTGFLIVAVSADEPKTGSTQTEVPVAVGGVVPVEVRAGSTATIRVPVSVATGYRVQANPASSEFLVPVELELEDAAGLVLGIPVYPEPEPYRLEGSDDDLLTYSGVFEITVEVSAERDARAGDRVAKGELRFQACNSRMCLFPSSVPVEVPLTVTASDRVDRSR